MSDVSTSEGCSPLALAIVNDYVYMAKKLIKLGANPNDADYNGDTPLIKAIWMTSNSNVEADEITSICRELVRVGNVISFDFLYF
jgi:ankyrin repeat protein